MRPNSHCSPSATASAAAKIGERQPPTAMPPASARLARLEARRCSIERGSAENSSSSTFWITIDSPKVTTSEGSGSPPERAVEHAALQDVAEPNAIAAARSTASTAHGPQPVAERRGADAAEGGEHDEVAVRDVGQPHHAEHQRQAQREQRVQAAEQHALQRRCRAIRPCSDAEVGREICSRVSDGARRPCERHAALLEAVEPRSTRAARATRPARRSPPSVPSARDRRRCAS